MGRSRDLFQAPKGAKRSNGLTIITPAVGFDSRDNCSRVRFKKAGKGEINPPTWRELSRIKQLSSNDRTLLHYIVNFLRIVPFNSHLLFNKIPFVDIRSIRFPVKFQHRKIRNHDSNREIHLSLLLSKSLKTIFIRTSPRSVEIQFR